MKLSIKPVVIAGALLAAGHAMAQVTFYEGQGFRGRSFSTENHVVDLGRAGFNDRANSVVVDRGRWEVCEDPGFRGRCAVLRRGSYDSLERMGLSRQISSVRPAGPEAAEAPRPPADNAATYRRGPDERVFEVPIENVRAVVGPPSQRCWIEREQVSEPVRNPPRVPGAILGTVVSRDVQRCTTVQDSTPDYWDVTYNFRGQEHHVQLASAPGSTIWVNEAGQPRQ